MIYYSNNGNTASINKEKEGTAEYILDALNGGYKLHLDVKLMSDESLYTIANEKLEMEWLVEHDENLLLHCINISSLIRLNGTSLHYYYQIVDNAVLTSHNHIVIYPGKRPIGKNCIAMLPEESDYQKSDLIKCFAVCSDNIEFYKKLIENENA